MKVKHLEVRANIICDENGKKENKLPVALALSEPVTPA